MFFKIPARLLLVFVFLVIILAGCKSTDNSTGFGSVWPIIKAKIGTTYLENDNDYYQVYQHFSVADKKNIYFLRHYKNTGGNNYDVFRYPISQETYDELKVRFYFLHLLKRPKGKEVGPESKNYEFTPQIISHLIHKTIVDIEKYSKQ